MNRYLCMGKSFLLIGGSSDIASLLAAQLLDSGHFVTLLARDIERTTDLEQQGAHIVQGDALDEEVVQGAVAHAAGLSEHGLAWVAHLVGSIALRPPHAMKVADF